MWFKILFKFLPEIVSLLNTIIELSKQGVEDITIKRNLKKIENAFKAKNRAQAVRELNDVFRKIH